MWSSKASRSPATGRKWKIPPPSLLRTHDRQPQAEPARGQQPADVVSERDVADQQHDRPARRAATPKALETVPSIPLAPRLERTPRRAGAPAGQLEITDRHRGGANTSPPAGSHSPSRRATSGLGRARSASSSLSARVTASSARATRRARIRATPTATVKRAQRLCRVARCARTDRGRDPASILGVERELGHVVEPRQPRPQRLRGRQVADPEHERRDARGHETRGSRSSRSYAAIAVAPWRAADSGSASSG